MDSTGLEWGPKLIGPIMIMAFVINQDYEFIPGPDALCSANSLWPPSPLVFHNWMEECSGSRTAICCCNTLQLPSVQCSLQGRASSGRILAANVAQWLNGWAGQEQQGG